MKQVTVRLKGGYLSWLDGDVVEMDEEKAKELKKLGRAKIYRKKKNENLVQQSEYKTKVMRPE